MFIYVVTSQVTHINIQTPMKGARHFDKYFLVKKKGQPVMLNGMFTITVTDILTTTKDTFIISLIVT